MAALPSFGEIGDFVPTTDYGLTFGPLALLSQLGRVVAPVRVYERSGWLSCRRRLKGAAEEPCFENSRLTPGRWPHACVNDPSGRLLTIQEPFWL
jgi:hypothetical protein